MLIVPVCCLQEDDHAARLARFALEAMEAALDTVIDEDGPDPNARVQIRVGLHCGPVSARFGIPSNLSILAELVRRDQQVKLCFTHGSVA